MTGYIKDFRKELDSDIWLMPPLYHRLWQYLKYKVNHSDKKIPLRDGSFMTIKKGQHLTSVRQLSQGVGFYEGAKWKEPNPKTISSILSWLEKQNMIQIGRGEGNRQYTLITLLNWDSYQVPEVQGNSKETVDGEAREQLMDINNNDKECIKNDKEEILSFLFDHYISKNIVQHKKLTDSMKRQMRGRLKDYSEQDLEKAIDNYATVLQSDDYWFTHKYTLADLMRDKDIRKFVDEADPLTNFLKEKSKQKKDNGGSIYF